MITEEVPFRMTRLLRTGSTVRSVSLGETGQDVLVGTERDLRLYNTTTGESLFWYAQPNTDLGFISAEMWGEGEQGYTLQRSGELLRIDCPRRKDGRGVDASITRLRHEIHDLFTLSIAPQAGLIAIGHFGPAITVLNEEGELVWRRHPDDHNATSARTWSVAFSSDSSTLYAGSSGVERNGLALFDATSGESKGGIRAAGAITAIAGPAAPLKIATVVNMADTSAVIAYADDLRHPAWEFRQANNHRMTALAADQETGYVVVGTAQGWLYVLDGQQGTIVAATDECKSVVMDVAIVGGRYVAAGLENGEVALLELEAEFIA